jgi:hypothetical protein
MKLRMFGGLMLLMVTLGCDPNPKGSPGGGTRGINQESSPGGTPNESKLGPNQIPKSQATNTTQRTQPNPNP